MTMKRVKVSKEEFNSTGSGDGAVDPMSCPTCGVESHPWLAHTHPEGKVELQDVVYHANLFKNRDGRFVFSRASDGSVNPAHWHASSVLNSKKLVKGEQCSGGKNCPQAHRAFSEDTAGEVGRQLSLGRQFFAPPTENEPLRGETWNPFNE